jgi:hypothetical protein
MFKNQLTRILILGVLFFLMAGCASTGTDLSYEIGWSHKCTLICTNVKTGQQEEIQRVGKNADFSAVCKETKLTCEAGRSAACVNTANWTNKNEPLYENCTAVDFGECSEGCIIN